MLLHAARKRRSASQHKPALCKAAVMLMQPPTMPPLHPQSSAIAWAAQTLLSCRKCRCPYHSRPALLDVAVLGLLQTHRLSLQCKQWKPCLCQLPRLLLCTMGWTHASGSHGACLARLSGRHGASLLRWHSKRWCIIQAEAFACQAWPCSQRARCAQCFRSISVFVAGTAAM